MQTLRIPLIRSGVPGGKNGGRFMFEFIRNQARRAQQQRHIKRGALARKRAIESTPATLERVPFPYLPESDAETASMIEQLSQQPYNSGTSQPNLRAD